MNASHTRHAALSVAIVKSVRADLIQAFIGASIGEQVCHALNAVHETGVHVCAQGDGLLCRAAAEDLREGGQDNAEAEEKDQENRSKRRVERCEKYRGEKSNDHSGQRRRNNSHVEIFQCFHIADDAREQIACAEFHQAGGGEGFEFFVEPDAQAGKQAEGDIVRDEPFKVAEDAACDAKEAHADNRDAEVCHGWMQARRWR